MLGSLPLPNQDRGAEVGVGAVDAVEVEEVRVEEKDLKVTISNPPRTRNMGTMASISTHTIHINNNNSNDNNNNPNIEPSRPLDLRYRLHPGHGSSGMKRARVGMFLT